MRKCWPKARSAAAVTWQTARIETALVGRSPGGQACHLLYLAERSLDHADRVEARLESRAANLSRFPFLGRPVPGSDLRELSIPDTQHVIVYRVHEDTVRILRIWSTAQER